MEKSIRKALADAGLSGRDVTPFMRVRVVGLTSKSNQRETHRKEGLITIWNPTEKQVNSVFFIAFYTIELLVLLDHFSSSIVLCL